MAKSILVFVETQKTADPAAPSVGREFDAERFTCSLQKAEEWSAGNALVIPLWSADRGGRVLAGNLLVSCQHRRDPIFQGHIAAMTLRDRQLAKLYDLFSGLLGPLLEFARGLNCFKDLRKAPEQLPLFGPVGG